MKWLATLVVIGLVLAWLGSRSLDMGFGALDQAVEVHREAQQRSERAAHGDGAASATNPVAPRPAVVAIAPPPMVTPTPAAKPPPAPTVRLTPDLVGLTRDAIERRLGSPTGRVYQQREEWWYDRQVLVFREGRVVGIE